MTQKNETYTCANCPGALTVADNLNGGLITLNVNGHARPAHRTCPASTTNDAKDL